MRLRIAITVIVLILYVALFDVYIFWFLDFSVYFDKMLYNWLTFGALLFVLLDYLCGFVNSHHRRFTLLIFLSVLVNYLLIMATVAQFFNTKEPRNMFY